MKLATLYRSLSLADAEREIKRLQREIRKYEARAPLGSGLTVLLGAERDLFAGEVAEVILCALRDSSTRALEGSRQKHILSSVLAANPVTEERNRCRIALKELLRGSTSLDSRVRQGLEQLGFEISGDGKHYKLVFQGDERYTYSLAKSGSDWRGGLNAASNIARLLFG